MRHVEEEVDLPNFEIDILHIFYRSLPKITIHPTGKIAEYGQSFSG